VTDQKSLTGEAAEFAASLAFKDIPDDALHIAKCCLPDGLAGRCQSKSALAE